MRFVPLFLSVVILPFLFQLTPQVCAAQEEPREERDYGNPADAPGEWDPATAQYYPKDSLWWLNEKARRETEYVNDLKRSGDLTVERYRERMKFLRSLSQPLPKPTSRVDAAPKDAISELRERAQSLSHGNHGGVLLISWAIDEHGDYSVQISHGRDGQKATILHLGDATDLTKLNNLVTTSGITLIEGDVPNNSNWHKWLRNRCKNCSVSSRHSANRTLSDKAFAALLGSTVRNPQGIIAFNALPYETSTVDSLHERTRMRIRGSRREWIAANNRIFSALGATGSLDGMISSSVAEKDIVLRELREGSADVVLIFAHSNGTKIYMPGKSGSSISLAELSAMKRQTAPDRVVVLVACDAGAVNKDTQSLAEALLAGKLARTVFAYPGAISPSYVPEMLERLRSGISLRSALSGLYQIVTLSNRIRHDKG